MPKSAALFACAGLLAFAAAGITGPSPREKAEGALAVAATYASAGDPAKAESAIASALEAVPQDGEVRKRAEEILKRISTDREARQRALLTEALRLADEGKPKEAAEMIRGKLDTLSPSMLVESEQHLATIHRHWLGARLKGFLRDGWLVDVVLALVLLFCLATLTWILRWLLAWLHRKDWLVTNIEDATNLGIGLFAFARLRRWSEEPTAASAGLLRLDALRVQSTPRFEQNRPDIALSTALAELPAFGQVNLSAVAKSMEALRLRVQGKRSSISIAAYTADQQILVRLTSRTRDGRIYSVAASGDKTLDGSNAVVDSASFKMYYLLANNASSPQVEAADQLRLGLAQLRRYITGRDPKALNSAYETFRKVRADNPGFEEAQLYEGIALDLMERHEEAEGIFHFLVENSSGEVQAKALYNAAVTKFRKYKPSELKLSIQLLDQLIGPEISADLAKSTPVLERLAQSPIQAMAVAAKANAIAHKPIFWQTLTSNQSRPEDLSKLQEWKKAAETEVFGWAEEVKKITDSLLRLGKLALSQSQGWDPLTQRQLLWASHNALGNSNLNIANCFLTDSTPEEQRKRLAFLDEAYKEFNICEMLLPPGVETLANIATNLLALSRLSEARNYAEAAIKLNPSYEYAYYRLAQAWDKEGKRGQVLKVLRSLKNSPKIPEFKKMFDAYDVKHGAV
jgi:tetratricopeptide (TPR) repeat protein